MVHVFGMYLLVSLYILYKYTLIHTFTTCDLRAGSCVRTSRPKVPLGLLMYVSHGRQHQRMALGACACSGRQPTGTFMFRGLVTYWAPMGGDFPCSSSMRRSLGRVRFGCSEASNAESMQETPLALHGARSKDRGGVGSGTRMYWYVSMYIGMY